MTTGSLYVHVPFCSKKCPYCHFFVQPLQDVDLYLDGIKREWLFRKSELSSLTSIYLGGGTPSLLTLPQLEILLALFPKAEEITIEANPETLSLETLQGYRSLGINRLSIGVQSLDDTHLLQIGRTHSANKAVEGILLAERAGFDNVSIDLMYDLPHQTLSQWKKTVDTAVQLPIHHLSLYNLMFEEGSSYYKRQKTLRPLMPTDEESLAMLHYAVERLEACGLKRYEISAFGKQSLHNVGYWTARPFLGLGPSAFSYIRGTRFRNKPHLKQWHAALTKNLDPRDFEETLPYPDNLHELFLVHLRLLSGAPYTHLPEQTKARLNELSLYLSLDKTHARLTPHGLLFYDTLASLLI